MQETKGMRDKPSTNWNTYLVFRGLLFDHERDVKIDIYYNYNWMNSETIYVKWKKADRESNMLYDPTDRKYLK